MRPTGGCATPRRSPRSPECAYFERIRRAPPPVAILRLPIQAFINSEHLSDIAIDVGGKTVHAHRVRRRNAHANPRIPASMNRPHAPAFACPGPSKRRRASLNSAQVVLAARCAYFRCMFESGMREAASHTVSLEDIP